MKSQLAVAVAVLLLLWLGTVAARREPPISGVSSGPPHVALLPGWRLWILLAICGLLASLAVGVVSGQPHNTALGFAVRFASLEAGTDSWGPMVKAIQHLRETPNAPLYRDLFFAEKVKFQYPTSALPFLDLAQRASGASWESLTKLSNGIGALSVPLLGLVVCALLMEASTPGAPSMTASRARIAIFAAIGVASAALFAPVTKSFIIGQVQAQITLAVALAMLAWQRQRIVLAGILMGVCCGIKPQWLVMVPWAILRRQWEFLIAFSATVATMTLLAGALYGHQNLVDYASVVAFLGRHGESQFANQSVNGLVNRLLFNGNNIEWSANSFPPFQAAVYGLTLASSILLLGAALVWRMGKAPSTIDFALIILTATIASPIAWDHHYGVLLPVLAILVPASIVHPPLGRWTVPYVIVAFLLVGQRLDMFTSRLAETGWNFLQSTIFFGAMLVLLLLYCIAGTSDAERRSPSAPGFVPADGVRPGPDNAGCWRA